MLQGEPRLRRGERAVLYDRDSRFGGPVEGVSGIGGMERGHGGIGARGPTEGDIICGFLAAPPL